MAVKDIVPELMDAIRTDYGLKLADSPELADIAERIAKGAAVLADGHELAVVRGELLSETLQSIITPSALPDGRMYFNIANRTVRPMLTETYTAINEAAARIQRALDEQDGIGLSPVRPEFAESRVAGLVNKLSDDGVATEVALKFLGEPIVNCSEAFFDDYIQVNAAARTRAGMTVRIVRTLGPAEVRPYRTKNNRMRLYRVPCAYCQSLAGVHEFTTLSEGAYLFARHEACRCIISYTNAKNPSASITRPLWER